jgi:hypothetical protein
MTVDLTNGLVSYWKFDEGTGVIASDSHSNNDWNMSATLWTASGKINASLEGTSTTGRRGRRSKINNVQTLNFWIRPTSVNNGYLFSVDNGEKGAMFFNSNSHFIIKTNNVATFKTTNIEFSVNTWYMVTIVIDGVNSKIYKNGQVVDVTITGTPDVMWGSSSGANIGIMNYIVNDNIPYEGKLDELGMWSRALNSTEIEHLFLSQSLGEEEGQYPDFKIKSKSDILKSNLFTYWKFDEGSGTTAVDSVGNQNGTLSRTQLWTTSNQKLGTAGLDFTDNVNQYVSIGSTSTYNFIHNGTSNFSFGYWIYRQGSALSGRVFDNNIGSDRRGFITSASDRRLSFIIGKQGSGWPILNLNVDDALPDTVGWHFVVFTFDTADGTDQGKLYVNGDYVSAATRTTGFEAGNSFKNPILGRYASSDQSRSNTYLDEVFFYKKVLTLTEIKWLYNNSDGVQYPFPFYYIKGKILNLEDPENVKVSLINTDKKELTGTVDSDTDGNYEFEIKESEKDDTFHVMAKYDDETIKKNVYSKPFVKPWEAE